jgi:Glu-tRNA(Gln) amidotransferase subunit E-like FAD-binding protein
MKEKQEEPNELDYKQVIRDGLILEITGALIRGRYVEAKKILDCDLGELNRKSVIEGVIQKLESYGITDDEIKKYLDVLNKKENLFYKISRYYF